MFDSCLRSSLHKIEGKIRLKMKYKESLHNIFNLKYTVLFEFDELLLMEQYSTSEARRSSPEWRRWPKIADWTCIKLCTMSVMLILMFLLSLRI